MKSLLFAVLLFSILVTLSKSLRLTPTKNISQSFNGEGISRRDPIYTNSKVEGAEEEIGMELYPTGSTLPDCSHACGPCFPCKRVMVSFKCTNVESCPVVYRCTCKGRYYQVPSS